jgi:hypothetical protein
MRITIIVVDGSEYKGDTHYGNLNFSGCGIPAEVSCMQWDGTSGWIEFFSSHVANEPITEIPAWAQACVQKWEEANNA